MKRSEVNQILADATAFFRYRNFHLPPWAEWSPAQWRQLGDDVAEIRRRRLGWDITDFGSGDFPRVGLVLFTLRNGDANSGRDYCEKIMIAGVGQVTPCHLHRLKTEDIINRGGGDLAITLWQADNNGKRKSGELNVLCDGFFRRVSAGEPLLLHPGESITLTPGVYHTFQGAGEPVLVGEVSKTNDDSADNFFYEPAGRFPAIEENEPALYPLCFEV